LAKNAAWPAAHLLAGQACSAMANGQAHAAACPLSNALDHLVQAAAGLGDKPGGSRKAQRAQAKAAAKAKRKGSNKAAPSPPEPPLPPSVRAQAYQHWLALAAHQGLGDSPEFSAVVEKALQLEPSNGTLITF
jgi:hypothetical protein